MRKYISSFGIKCHIASEKTVERKGILGLTNRNVIALCGYEGLSSMVTEILPEGYKEKDLCKRCLKKEKAI